MVGPTASDGYFTLGGVNYYEAPHDMTLKSMSVTYRDGQNLANMPTGIQFAQDQSIEQQYLLALDGILNSTIDPKEVTLTPLELEQLILPGGNDELMFTVKKGQRMWFYQIDTGSSGLKGHLRLEFTIKK